MADLEDYPESIWTGAQVAHHFTWETDTGIATIEIAFISVNFFLLTLKQIPQMRPIIGLYLKFLAKITIHTAINGYFMCYQLGNSE